MTTKDFIVVTDHYLMDMVKDLNNLTDEWKTKLKSGSLKLSFAIQVGSKLTAEKQRQFLEFIEDTSCPERFLGKMLHAYSVGMPEWSIHSVLRIFKCAEKTKKGILMYNDLMDQYEEILQQFQYRFWEGEWPESEDQLEKVLGDVERELEELSRKIPTREQSSYNRTYGDSSSDAKENELPWSEDYSFQTLIGVAEDATSEEIQKRSRSLLKKLHPDVGGSAYLFTKVKQAYDQYFGSRT